MGRVPCGVAVLKEYGVEGWFGGETQGLWNHKGGCRCREPATLKVLAVPSEPWANLRACWEDWKRTLGDCYFPARNILRTFNNSGRNWSV